MVVESLIVKKADKILLDLSFSVGDSLALVGQSGSGKSLTLKALLGMLPSTLVSDLRLRSEFELLRGKSVAFVPQNPFNALSPLTKIRDQFFSSRLEELFALVDLDASLADRYPSELSGGQLQRVVIAMALSIDPMLMLLDEPTTALDPDSKRVVLDLLTRLRDRVGFKMIFVSHDLDSAMSVCEDVCVLKGGVIVERGRLKEVASSPKEAYTKLLIESNFATRGFRE
ncbi:MAG: ATP-binding cassette domain-containing protein [Sulfuricurvum sp.]